MERRGITGIGFPPPYLVGWAGWPSERASTTLDSIVTMNARKKKTKAQPTGVYFSLFSSQSALVWSQHNIRTNQQPARVDFSRACYLTSHVTHAMSRP